MAELPAALVLGQHRLDRLETQPDPMIEPFLDRLLVMAQRLRQIAQHAQIIQGMDVAGDDLGYRAHPRLVGGDF